MFILIFITIVLVVYIAAFKNDFTKENIDKLIPVLALLIFLLLLFVFISIARGG